MSHEETPLALVDRDGVVWPWDGRPRNEYLESAGSRYIYDEADLKATLAQYELRLKSQARGRRAAAPDPAEKPKRRKRVGTAAEVAKAVLDRGEDKPKFVEGAEA